LSCLQALVFSSFFLSEDRDPSITPRLVTVMVPHFMRYQFYNLDSYLVFLSLFASCATRPLPPRVLWFSSRRSVVPQILQLYLECLQVTGFVCSTNGPNITESPILPLVVSDFPTYSLGY
jgi:hypothetical protein